jgi:hypothetical protein
VVVAVVREQAELLLEQAGQVEVAMRPPIIRLPTVQMDLLILAVVAVVVAVVFFL